MTIKFINFLKLQEKANALGYLRKSYRKGAYLSDKGDDTLGSMEVQTQQKKDLKRKVEKSDQRIDAASASGPTSTEILAK